MVASGNEPSLMPPCTGLHLVNERGYVQKMAVGPPLGHVLLVGPGDVRRRPDLERGGHAFSHFATRHHLDLDVVSLSPFETGVFLGLLDQ